MGLEGMKGPGKARKAGPGGAGGQVRQVGRVGGWWSRKDNCRCGRGARAGADEDCRKAGRRVAGGWSAGGSGRCRQCSGPNRNSPALPAALTLPALPAFQTLPDPPRPPPAPPTIPRAAPTHPSFVVALAAPVVLLPAIPRRTCGLRGVLLWLQPVVTPRCRTRRRLPGSTSASRHSRASSCWPCANWYGRRTLAACGTAGVTCWSSAPRPTWPSW